MSIRPYRFTDLPGECQFAPTDLPLLLMVIFMWLDRMRLECFLGGGDQSLYVLELLFGEISPLPYRDIQLDVHDAHAFQFDDVISQILTHPAYLAVESLGEHDFKFELPRLSHVTLAGDRVQDGNSRCHGLDEGAVDGLVYFDIVLFFVVIGSAQDLVHDVAIVGEKDESLTGLVQTTDGEYPLGVLEKVDDVVFLSFGIGGANNAHGFIKSDINGFFGLGQYLNPIDANDVGTGDLGAQFGNLAVDGDSILGNQFIGMAARTISGLAEEFIDSNGSFF